jgi:precorrin-3B synthase
MTAPVRQGWCPGALRPMQTGDGILLRLRLTCGVLTTDRARARASLSERYGNGLIDLTTRANLQLRGVSLQTLNDIMTALRELDLVDADVEAEAIRNVIASPLAGLDPRALVDIRPAVAALEGRLAADRSLRHLPAKFGFLFDDGGSLPLASVDADVRFEASAGNDGPRFVIRLAGVTDRCLGSCTPEEVPAKAAAIARAFLTLRATLEDAPRRMHRLIARVGIEMVARVGGLSVEAFGPASGNDAPPSAVVGVHSIGSEHYIGAAVAFGRLNAGQLERLASIASRAGAEELRLTPWRTILVAGLSHEVSVQAASQLQTLGFVLSAGDPRLSVAACPGAPACSSASTSVQEDASAIASLIPKPLPSKIFVHVSGCMKGCAHRKAATITLVGNAGRYDLVENGTARDTPLFSGVSTVDLPRVLRDHWSAYRKDFQN